MKPTQTTASIALSLQLLATNAFAEGPQCKALTAAHAPCAASALSSPQCADQTVLLVYAKASGLESPTQEYKAQLLDIAKRMGEQNPAFMKLAIACSNENLDAIKRIINQGRETIKSLKCAETGCSKG